MDPIDQFNELEKENEKALNMMPCCDMCNKRIQEDYAYSIDGKLYCEDCVKDSLIWIDYMD